MRNYIKHGYFKVLNIITKFAMCQHSIHIAKESIIQKIKNKENSEYNFSYQKGTAWNLKKKIGVLVSLVFISKL